MQRRESARDDVRRRVSFAPLLQIARQGQVVPFLVWCANFFAWSYVYYLCVAWIPSSLHDRFSLDFEKSAWLSALPYVAQFVAGNFAGRTADMMLSFGVQKPVVRLVFQVTAMFGAAIGLICYINTETAFYGVLWLCIMLGLLAFHLAGGSCYHIDNAKKDAGLWFSIGNGFGILGGIISVPLTGALIDAAPDPTASGSPGPVRCT